MEFSRQQLPQFDPSLCRMLLFGPALVIVVLPWRRAPMSTRASSTTPNRGTAVGASLGRQGRG